MGQKARPSWEVRTIIWDIAAKVGPDNYVEIQRQLDYELEKRRQGLDDDAQEKQIGRQGGKAINENTPDVKTIKKIVAAINDLHQAVVLASLPRHVWTLRNDYDDLKHRLEAMTRQAGASTERTASGATEVDAQLVAREPVNHPSSQAHWLPLFDLLRRFREQVEEVSKRGPFGILTSGNLWLASSRLGVLEDGGYPAEPGSEVLKWEESGERGLTLWLAAEEDRSFKYLQQHLEGEGDWKAYKEWKGVFREALMRFYEWEITGEHADPDEVQIIAGRLDDAAEKLLDALTKLELRRTFESQCDACP